jgi:hypothetical protein
MNHTVSRKALDEIHDLIAEVQVAERQAHSLLSELNTLLSIVHEEVSSNGGTFSSMYSHTMFMQKFGDFENKSVIEILDLKVKEIKKQYEKNK